MDDRAAGARFAMPASVLYNERIQRRPVLVFPREREFSPLSPLTHIHLSNALHSRPSVQAKKAAPKKKAPKKVAPKKAAPKKGTRTLGNARFTNHTNSELPLKFVKLYPPPSRAIFLGAPLHTRPSSLLVASHNRLQPTRAPERPPAACLYLKTVGWRAPAVCHTANRTNPLTHPSLRFPHPSCQEGCAQEEGRPQEEGRAQEEVSAQLLQTTQPSRGNRRWIQPPPW